MKNRHAILATVSVVLTMVCTVSAQHILGPERSGLAFRILWFETADDTQDAAITRFVFPAGATYPSQEIRRSLPILPGATVSTDREGNISMTYADVIPVKRGRPVLMGFVADVSYFGPAYHAIDPRKVGWKKRVPLRIKRSHLSDEPEYDLFDPGIQKVVQELRRDHPSPTLQMERIWSFVNQHMRADLPPRPNTGAEVLRLGKGLCGEYTRLTATLSRACGLPARESHAFGMFVTGPASNDHAWADIYLPGAGWTPVQPQETCPENSRYPLHYYRYLVVYRGISFIEKHRIIEHHNVIQNRSSGVGFFAEMPARLKDGHRWIKPRRQAMELMRSISGDDGNKAPRLLDEIDKAHVAAQPILYWALAGSSDAEVGRTAASRLVALCRDGERKLELARFADLSPTLVRHRIDLASGQLMIPDQAKKYGPNTYYVFDKKMPWYSARKYCEMLGGHLVTITSREEQAFVQRLPEQLGKGNRFWIGLSTTNPDEPWRWVTDETFDYSNWARGFPDTGKPLWSMRTRPEMRTPDADFTALAFAPNRWIDAEGAQLKGFVCEWEEQP